MKKILAGFYEAERAYAEAYERGDKKNALKLGGEFVAYVEKFQKELTISDEYMKGMKEALSKLQQSTKKAADREFELEAVRRKRKLHEQEYHRLLLEQTPEGKKRTKH